MSRMLERGGDFFEGREEKEPRDVVLGTTALLSIFFAVAIVCAVCFGFGYSRGHGGSASTARQKPEPRPLGGSFSGAAEPAGALPAQPSPSLHKPSPGAADQAALPEEAAGELPGMPPDIATASAQEAAARPSPAVSHAAAAPAVAAAPPKPGLNLMVQIAAVSHAADADTLAGALRHNGFRAMVRTASADPLFHVQVGPFTTLDAAKAMRSRLVDSGYNAFIKP